MNFVIIYIVNDVAKRFNNLLYMSVKLFCQTRDKVRDIRISHDHITGL